MKSTALLALLVTAATSQAEVAVVPERLPMDRYAKLKSDAPFAVKTIDETPVTPKIDWAESLYLSGAAKYTENGAEKDWVYINHKSDPGASFQLSGTEPNAEGIQIVKLDWHPENPVLTEVQVRKGTEFAIIKRDKAAYTPPMNPGPQPGQVGIRPGQPSPIRPGQPNPIAVPGAGGAIRQPIVQPRAPVIPRPGGTAIPAPQQPQQPQAVPGTQQNQGDRRRIRVINSK